MKSQSNSQERSRAKNAQVNSQKLETIIHHIIIDGADDALSSREIIDEYKPKLLELGLSCLPEKVEVPVERKDWNPKLKTLPKIIEAWGHNAAIDTMEQKINLKFGGSDE